MPRKSDSKTEEDAELTTEKEKEPEVSTEAAQPTTTETTTNEPLEPSPSPAPSMQPSSSRPKRQVRKSVLYNNADYELQLPGVPKEEETARQDNDVAPELVKEGGLTKRSRAALSGDRPAKKRRPHYIVPKPDEREEEEEQQELIDHHVYADSCLQLGAETEIPHSFDDEGPPKLGMDYDGEVTLDDEMNYADDEETYLEGRPPELEMHLPTGKRRGRPRKPHQRHGEELVVEEEAPKKSAKINRAGISGAVRAHRGHVLDRMGNKMDRNQQFGVKLFEDDIEVTETGDCYATVINGCLAYLLRKERIIELLTEENEINMIREGGWMLDKPPRLPPFVPTKSCFAFYVDGSKLTSVKEISNDDLKPWSSTVSEQSDQREAVVKPNVRRHPIARVDGRLTVVKGDPRMAELHLTEYSAWLPRLLRLRKKIFYLSREGQIYGNILILYDYTAPGELPCVVNLPHGNDFLRPAIIDSEEIHTIGDADNPFEEEMVQGPRGGTFLRVKPNKLGWAHNKKLLLKYLINEPELLNGTEALNRRIPNLPPLIEHAGVFVFFAPANLIANQIHHAVDGLSPWTINTGGETSSPRVRSTRRALVQDENGLFVVTKEQWQQTGVCIVETMSVLARCPRIRKRVIYVQRSQALIIGNVCYIYEFLRDGPLPSLVKSTGKQGIVEGMQWGERKKNGLEEDQFIDVEDLEVVEEEVIDDHMHHHDLGQRQHQMGQLMTDNQGAVVQAELEEMSEDVLNGGFDIEFDEDSICPQDNADPYYDQPRVLESGHVYLTVRHKRVAGTFDQVLEWIANTNIVEERGILNYSKPGHPPIVRNARAYAFFVAGTAIFPHDINRDDFSPWSHNGNHENKTCYRTKVRKIGVICDEIGAQFQIKDVDYKSCPFHLVFLYSINPRDPRLRKKIYYMMETESRLVVSHALVIYDYNIEGPLPRLHGGYMKRFSRRINKRNTQPLSMHDIDNDVSDISETEKECPFILPPQMADDGTMYLQLVDMEFWNDRNRQLHFLVNKPSLVETLQCLNNRVPALPPATMGKGGFVFFVDGCEVDCRNLTCDGLVPWSENVNSNPHGTTKRPKSSKTPLALNRNGQLRVWKTPQFQNRQTEIEFQLHVYSATLPRCPRLKKKVTYVLKDGHQLGHAMIIYMFTESGEMPIPINLNSLSPEVSAQRLPHHVRDEASRLLQTHNPGEVAKIIYERHGMTIAPRTLYYLRRRDILAIGQTNDVVSYDIKNEMLDQYVDPDWPSTSAQSEELMMAKPRKDNLLHDTSIIEGDDIQVGHTEEIQIASPSVQFQRNAGPRNSNVDNSVDRAPNMFYQKSMSTGMIRGSQRYDALWRIAKTSFGTSNDTDTFDSIWKMMLEKNEQRLLHNVHQTFGIEIIAGVGEDGGMGDGDMMHLTDEHGMEEMEHQMEDGQMDKEPKVYMGEEKDHRDAIEQVIVEEEVHDHLLDEASLVVDDVGVVVDEEEMVVVGEMEVVDEEEVLDTQ